MEKAIILNKNMILINNIFKDRLTDKLNFKTRYNRNPYNILSKNSYIYNLDDINYCLYSTIYNSFFIKPNNYIKYYNKNGFLHRDGDLPAVIDVKGNNVYYYKNGKYHRDDDLNGNLLHAVIWSNRHFHYYKEGKLIKETKH